MELQIPRRGRGRGDPRAGGGDLLLEGGTQVSLGGDRPQRDPWGASPPRASPPPVPAPQAPLTWHYISQLSPAIAALRTSHGAVSPRCSRCCREWPCPTAPSSLARPPREASPPLSRSLGAAATPCPLELLFFDPRPGFDSSDLEQGLPLGVPTGFPKPPCSSPFQEWPAGLLVFLP